MLDREWYSTDNAAAFADFEQNRFTVIAKRYHSNQISDHFMAMKHADVQSLGDNLGGSAHTDWR